MDEVRDVFVNWFYLLSIQQLDTHNSEKREVTFYEFITKIYKDLEWMTMSQTFINFYPDITEYFSLSLYNDKTLTT